MHAKNIIKEGTAKVLGRLEQEILDILWSKGGLSGKDIFFEIRNTRAIAVTTVLTVIERLTKKGLITKEKGKSVYIFRPAYTREEFARKASSEVLKGIFEISAAGASASFVDMLAEEDPDEFVRLSALVETKKKELEGKRR